MIGPLARRWATALFLLFSPGVGGAAVTALHGCTMAMGAAAPTADLSSTHQHAHHHAPPPPAPGPEAPAHQHADGVVCTCPAMAGGVHLLAAATIPSALPPTPVEFAWTGWPVVERTDAVDRPLDRLPPATAPPHS